LDEIWKAFKLLTYEDKGKGFEMHRKIYFGIAGGQDLVDYKTWSSGIKGNLEKFYKFREVEVKKIVREITHCTENINAGTNGADKSRAGLA
jgi:hypothetical protein